MKLGKTLRKELYFTNYIKVRVLDRKNMADDGIL